MTIKVLLRSAVLLSVLLALLATFATATVIRLKFTHPITDGGKGDEKDGWNSGDTKENETANFDTSYNLNSSSGPESGSGPTRVTYSNSTAQNCNPETEFRCQTDGECLPENARCNGIAQCIDDSDEADCPPPEPPTTLPVPKVNASALEDLDEEFIPATESLENDYPELPEPTAERESGEEIECRGDQTIRCKDGKGCIGDIQRCDGGQDCDDNSDEENCPHPDSNGTVRKCNPETELSCQSKGHCIPLSAWCDGIFNCIDESDEANCTISETTGTTTEDPEEDTPTVEPPRSCKFDEATCSNGDCIPKSRVCDGRYDCTDGTDEIRCGEHGCEPNQFRCANKECVSKVWRCDGDRDCADGSDEQNCEPPPPGSPCKYNEYQCASNQCILKSFHCDTEWDCLDGSDEIGCTKAQILRPPQHMVILNKGETFTITCTARGIPIPEIGWLFNWGLIPAKCTTTSANGTGVLTCPAIASEDQGTYSCEAINARGSEIAVPDAILKVEDRSPPNVCPRGTFNSLARTADVCISCFCFGVATKCSSADLFTYQLSAPFDQYNVVSVETDPDIKILPEVTENAPDVLPVGRNGVQVSNRYIDSANPNSVLYFALPESYHNSQLKSYGGYLKYTVKYTGRGGPNNAPSVILTGNNYVLIHKGEYVTSDHETERSVRFFFGDWVRKQGWDVVTASREEIMMALAHVENILIKVEYDDGPVDTTITNVYMDTAGVGNTNQGAATFVEECRCPVGYSGLSCEHCESGYARRDSGPWLGQCYREEPPCQPGYYRDPSRNIQCQPCPCPLTNPSNQYSRTCQLGSDGQPTCDCPQGYLGRRCEQCAPGYQGNPLRPGDSCVKVDECDLNGSISPYADPATGVCRCKALATGRTCNKCKANTFHLAATNKFGCVSCFCMGVTSKCTSSNWYRSEIHVAFTSSIRDFSLVESRSTDPSPIADGIRLNKIDREIVYDAFPNRETNDCYYWQLPSNFLGDQLASYGGNLKYTVRYVPSPGGGGSRNNAADVELISSNDIILRHYSGKQLDPNTAETLTIQLLEDHWQRNDGTTADRENLLMALADVQAIRIKATYTTHTDEAALSSISLDTAVNSNTGKARAVEVEQCSCPTGYRGLSCEDCDVGYTRSDDGLYLGRCLPCNCNGHSTQCDPGTGTCENCRDHTSGENCESCNNGYEGDATRGSQQDCEPVGDPTDPPSCSCDPAGSLGPDCSPGQCECKSNVEGLECNLCRRGTFGLSVDNIDGCIECYCSGVTNECHESSLYVDRIPTVVYDSTHGFTLTDSNRKDVIRGGFDLNTATNEIGYRYPDSRSQRLFWSLPSLITHNQVKSYGGNLWITQHITTRPGAVSEKDQDVVLIGNGNTLYWTNPEEIQPGIPLTYSVPLVESAWTRLTQEEGLRTASRADLMSVLSNLEAILVRATHSSEMTATYISDVSLDTAVEQLVNNRRATQVEACRCPPGYTGTSCETCAYGYYRDVTDTSRSFLGACNICPCNGREQECKVDRYGVPQCYCLPGFTGPDCSEHESSTTDPPTTTTLSPPPIVVEIYEDPIRIVEIGSSVTYQCAGRSEGSTTISIEWQKESGQLPAGRSYDDEQGILIIRDVKVSDSGIYVCQVSDGISIGVQKVTLIVGVSKPRPIIEPRYLSVQEGNPVEFQCKSSGNPQPQLSWIRVQGEINPAATFENGTWRLQSVRKSDEAGYKCIAQNSAGTTEVRTILYVTARDPSPPSSPIINPADYTGSPNVPLTLVCPAYPGSTITWTRSDNASLSASAVEQNGILTIYEPSPSDSGYYICTAITFEGVESRSTARVTIQFPRTGPPSVTVEPKRQEVSQGTLAEVKCIVTGDPTPTVTWTKYREPLAAHVQVVGNTLRIINPQVSDRGIYICHASSSGGNAQDSAMIDVNRREMPVIELYPQQKQVVRINGSALLQCRATGAPAPSVSWAREDSRLFSSNVEQLPGGILRFNHITLGDGGSFVCTASNQVGSVSQVAIIEISTPPLITITPSNLHPLTVRFGDRVKLTCAASGQPQPVVSWSKHINGVPTVYNTPSKSQSTMAVYEISSVSYDDEGAYTCLAENAYGPVEERIQIRVDNAWSEPDTSTPNPNTSITIPESLRIPSGAKIELRCQLYGSNLEAIHLDWKRHDGRNLPQRSTVHDGILLIPAVTKDDAGVYICQGLNSNGNILFTTTTNLEIISPPRIELEPIQQIVRRGESPAVNCRVTGDQPIDIEWHAINGPLPYTVSQNGGFLQFNGITSADAGKYLCIATNNAGTAEAVVEILINEDPRRSVPENHI